MDSVDNTKGALPSLPVLLACTTLVYWCGLYLYRLFLHPLSKFPGPRLAAATSWYEAYYEIVLKGQYSRQISKLHDQYGRSTQGLAIYTCSPLVSCHIHDHAV